METETEFEQEVLEKLRKGEVINIVLTGGTPLESLGKEGEYFMALARKINVKSVNFQVGDYKITVETS
ncbi:MAG TPA: hypothetical protein VLH19_00560 [Patescibacteria group bacterium]|nr:hypothetical protein [Patescibacteria group bacterium]